jgi:hypothetical protein
MMPDLVATFGEPVEPRHRFGVVIQNIRTGVEYGAQRRFIALKVRDQHLDARVRRAGANFADRFGEHRRAAVRHIIAIDRRDDDVRQSELAHGVGDARGLRPVDCARPAVPDSTVAAGARADIAQDHERRRAVRPALPDVGAARLLANRVQVEVAHQTFQSQVRR